MNKKMVAKTILLSILGLIMLGCSLRVKSPPYDIYYISYSNEQDCEQKNIEYKNAPYKKSLKLYPIRGDNNFNTYVMAYRKESNMLDFYENSKWAQPPTIMLYTYMLSYFENCVPLNTLPYTSSIKEDYRLDAYLIDFTQNFYNNNQYASIKVIMILSDGKNNLISTKVFEEEDKISNMGAKYGTSSLQKSLEKLSLNTLKWVNESLAMQK